MNFGFSEEQEQLRTSIRDWLSAEVPTTYARSAMDDPIGMRQQTWTALAELGWLGLTIPEAHGGSGLGQLELAIVLEEMGKVVMPGPYMSTVALAIPAIVAAADEAQSTVLLPAVADGSVRVTVAAAEAAGACSPQAVTMRVEPAGSGLGLQGEKWFVPDAVGATDLLVLARHGDGFAFVRVGRDQRGVNVEALDTVDRTRKLARVKLDVEVGADALLGGRAIAEADLQRWIAGAKTSLAAEMVGCADAVLTMSVEYAKIREQFGRPIGSFQAIQHKCADMKVVLENARSLVYYAAWAIDEGRDDACLSAAMAKAYASDACMKVAADGVQVHGGIGFTWEHDMQLFFKRLKASEVTYGDATANREMVASLMGW